MDDAEVDGGVFGGQELEFLVDYHVLVHSQILDVDAGVGILFDELAQAAAGVDVDSVVQAPKVERVRHDHQS